MALHSVQALCPSLDGEVKIGKRMAASFKRPIRVHKQQKRARGPALSWEQRSKLSSKCGFATLLDPHRGRSALASLGALRSLRWRST